MLETMPDIDQTLLQFSDVTNLVDLLLHFTPSFVVKPVQICAVGCQKCGEINTGLLSIVPARSVSSSRSIALLEGKEHDKDLTHCRH